MRGWAMEYKFRGRRGIFTGVHGESIALQTGVSGIQISSIYIKKLIRIQMKRMYLSFFLA